METDHANNVARKFMPVGTKIYCVRLRSTGSGNRLVRFFVIDDSQDKICKLEDVTPMIGRVINKRVTPKEGGLWSTDPSNIIASLGIALYPDVDRSWASLHFYDV